MSEKLSEAVEKIGYDVLPEAKPEDFEITTVAAVSEPFADAKVRNKAARERFKKMIDDQTKKAKETLNLDKQLPERQVNGNGKLVEEVRNAHEARKAIKDAFDDAYWDVYSRIEKDLADKLEKNETYNDPAFRRILGTMDSRLRFAFNDCQDKYFEIFVKGINESKKDGVLGSVEDYLTKMKAAKNIQEVEKIVTQAKGNPNADKAYELFINDKTPKISLDESLFEAVEEPEKVSLNESKPLKEEARVNVSIRNYKPWNGAVYTFNKIQEANKLEALYDIIEEVFPDGIDEQALNDLLRFDADWVYEMLGMEVEE